LTSETTSEFAVLDGELMPVAEAAIPVSDDGFKRGDGVFEALRVYAGRSFGLEEHLQRLLRSANGILLREVDVNAISGDVASLIAAKGETDFGVRIICTRGGHRVVISEELHVYPPSIALATVEYQSTIVLDGLKTLSYGANVLANRIAEERGFDEALLVTPSGEVLEGPTASIFWSPDGETLITPPLEDGILASITRQVLIDAIDVEVRPTSKDDLLTAREAFLCSSIREVQAIGQIDENRMPVPGPLTAAAKQAYAAAVEARLAAAA
jgi:branched-chain amino acid aminotransferase